MNSIAGSEIYVGLMSGTSLDGVDVAIVDFANSPPDILYSNTTAYSEALRQRLQALCHADSTKLDILYTVDAELGEVYAETVNRALSEARLESSAISAIGCHGQTIRHQPDIKLAYSAQIGDPTRVAVLTGITTVADFRRKDIALGGQAAPLAPAFHNFMFRTDRENRALINIGGIANITHLPQDPGAAITGFDTGPGNTLLDYWIERHQGQAYDRAGSWARGGRTIDALLQEMLATEPYFDARAPKSTGTDYFNADWLQAFLKPSYAAQDVQTTLAELTAVSLADAIRGLPGKVNKCFVCGGGAHNDYLLECLGHRLPSCDVATTGALGLDPDFVEAAAFAWLARQRINQRCGNVPSVTRAKQATILGGVYRAD